MKYYRESYGILLNPQRNVYHTQITLTEAWLVVRGLDLPKLEITCNRLIQVGNNMYMVGIKQGSQKLVAFFFDDETVGSSFLRQLKDEIGLCAKVDEENQKSDEFSRTIFVSGQPVGVITDSEFYHRLKSMQVIDYADY